MAETKQQVNNLQAGDKGSVSGGDQSSNLTGNSQNQNSSRFERKRQPKGKKNFSKNKNEERQEEFEQRIVDIARVTRVMAGGKRMRFRACVAIGNKRGRVAIGLAKGADVTMAVTKAVNKAKKNFIEIPIINESIPHEIYQKLGAAKILMKPARKGKGIIAGGAVRILLEISGVKNITCKILGTGNKINNVKCAIEALNNLKKVDKKLGGGDKAAVAGIPE